MWFGKKKTHTQEKREAFNVASRLVSVCEYVCVYHFHF